MWLDKRLGPFYDQAGTAKLLGVDEAQLERLAEGGVILRVVTPDGYAVFPTFQFSEHGQPLPRLSEVLAFLRVGTSNAWTWALWLNTRLESRGNRSAAELLRIGEAETVLRDAWRDGDRWSQ